MKRMYGVTKISARNGMKWRHVSAAGSSGSVSGGMALSAAEEAISMA